MSDNLAAVRATLDVLRRYYADRDGKPHQLNETQLAVYLDGLRGHDAATLEASAREHMRRSKFFPKVSELLELITPPVDYSALAHLAWAKLERELRRIGAYRSVAFVDPGFGETVRQVFGSWSNACSIDLDSPAWAIRRQTFLAVFPQVASRTDLQPVTLHGLQRGGETAVVGALAGMPSRPALAAPDKSGDVMAEVRKRFKLLQSTSSGQ